MNNVSVSLQMQPPFLFQGSAVRAAREREEHDIKCEMGVIIQSRLTGEVPVKRRRRLPLIYPPPPPFRSLRETPSWGAVMQGHA